MTNIDPMAFPVFLGAGGAIVLGVATFLLAFVAARLGVGRFRSNCWVLLGVIVAVPLLAAAFSISTGVTAAVSVLAIAGAFLVARSSVGTVAGWMLGLVLAYAAVAIVQDLGLVQGFDQQGQPLGPVAANWQQVWLVGQFVAGVVGGGIVRMGRWVR